MVGTTVADNYYDSNDGDNSGRGGGGYIASGTASFTNCVFTGNNSRLSDGGGLYVNEGDVTIENCTFADNGGETNSPSPEGGALYVSGGTVSVTNSIFWGNEAGNDGSDGDALYQANGTLSIGYSCLEGTSAPHLVSAGGTLALNAGVITEDPLFAVEYTDVHLKSMGGRWDGSNWVRDDVNSPCVDAGDPASDYSRETDKNGGRINMGAYGNTAEASRTDEASGAVMLIR